MSGWKLFGDGLAMVWWDALTGTTELVGPVIPRRSFMRAEGDTSFEPGPVVVDFGPFEAPANAWAIVRGELVLWFNACISEVRAGDTAHLTLWRTLAEEEMALVENGEWPRPAVKGEAGAR